VTPAVRFAALLSLSGTLCLARTWSGSLVDSKCYAAEERNVNPTDTLTNVDRDGNREIRYCAPGSKTKSFAVVQFDGQAFDLDSAGNAKAAELVRKAGKRHPLSVAITGETAGKEIRVDSISASPKH
jgi:hypothetical protein